jgi:murein DD-endopeptidase MepM/ murein hydrolase activator NlpD
MIRPALAARCASAGLLTGLLLVAASPAVAHTTATGGGAAAPVAPQLQEVQCGTEATATCDEGELLRIKGEYLDSTRTVVFMGARGRADDRRVKPRARSPHRVVVRIPAAAPSGRVRVFAGAAGASAAGPRVRVVPKPAPKAATPGQGVASAFPVGGTYDFGTEVNRFGGGRNHQGQDILAKCGTPLRAGLSGTVTMKKWQDAAGNYVVIKADDGTSQAYMHMQEPASVSRGDRVEAGQAIGVVGTTGRSSACHLHFELWTAPGWYEGGEAIDPLPTLKRWARAG